MKKLILLLGIMLLSTACPWDGTQNTWAWGVENNTTQTLMFKYPDNNGSGYRTETISSGGHIILRMDNLRDGKKANFGDYFEDISGKYNDAYWQILSEDGATILKTWKYSDKNSTDQRFFEESKWSFREVKWAFEIPPTDITE